MAARTVDIVDAQISVPTFLGIGVPRAGTTWLHELLASHPDISVPGKRKELHYFDENYHRGAAWYRSWFPEHPTRAVGEVTPHYLYDPASMDRIRGAGIDRFIVVLRDPVARAISHHQLRSRVDGSSANFATFLADHPDAIEWGRYATHLAPWLDAFGRDAFCVLRFDHAVSDVAATKQTLGVFLGVDPAVFPGDAGTRVVNDSGPLRYPRAFALAKRVARRTRRADVTWVGRVARRLAIDRALVSSANPAPAPEPSGEDIERLRSAYAPEIDALEQMLDWDLSAWRGTV